jgi:tetratricopeptide (TPR) repeat protein
MTYPSRLLQSLDQQIQQCTDLIERSRLISRRAIYFARLNQLDVARAEINHFRAQIGPALEPAVGAWIMLAEGVVEYFEVNIDLAYDRLRRSYAISKSAGIIPAVAAAGSWLAHVSAEKGDFPSAIDHIQEASRLVDKDDISTKSRIFQVAGVLFGDANQIERSQEHFRSAHRLATFEGDESSLGALLYNRTIHRLVNSMLADARGHPLPGYFDQLVLEVNSSAAFDGAFHGIGLKEYPLMFRGHTFSIKKEYQQAVDILSNLNESNIFLYNRATALADLAYCQVGLRDFDAASHTANLALNVISDCKGSDDQTIAHGRLSQAFIELGDSTRSIQHRILAEQSESNFRIQQEHVAKLLENFEAPS